MAWESSKSKDPSFKSLKLKSSHFPALLHLSDLQVIEPDGRTAERHPPNPGHPLRPQFRGLKLQRPILRFVRALPGLALHLQAGANQHRPQLQVRPFHALPHKERRGLYLQRIPNTTSTAFFAGEIRIL